MRHHDKNEEVNARRSTYKNQDRKNLHFCPCIKLNARLTYRSFITGHETGSYANNAFSALSFLSWGFSHSSMICRAISAGLPGSKYDKHSSSKIEVIDFNLAKTTG